MAKTSSQDHQSGSSLKPECLGLSAILSLGIANVAPTTDEYAHNICLHRIYS